MLSVQVVIQILSLKKHFYSYLLFFIISLCVIVQKANNITIAVDKYSWGCDDKRICQENIFMIFFLSKQIQGKKDCDLAGNEDGRKERANI